MNLLRTAFRLVSPPGRSARLSILIFHRVLAQPDPLQPHEPDARRFSELLGWLKDWFTILPLDAAIPRLIDGSLPARAAAITFDDGYADNHDVALPLLKAHGLPATFFIATGHLDGGAMWNDRIIESVRTLSADAIRLDDVPGLPATAPVQLPARSLTERRAAIDFLLQQLKYLEPESRLEAVAAIAARNRTQCPGDLMMSSGQVKAMAHAGMGIGAHTATHPILARLDERSARTEVCTSKSFLETLLGEPVRYFAYPNGKPDLDYTARDAAIVRDAGFTAAFSTAWGATRPGDDLFQLPRFTAWDTQRRAFGTRMLRNLAFTTPQRARS
ncbi:polysaccharide deacetylase family protein [Rhodocyclus tenuis]|uniref:polysaccharide deacetylase family protein n=1 Tax=Rhodocyclus tenuis TaxID=1066 RepID=UPI0019046ECB|nr:polysaccharide deacetylase family protein [Rhodocyclus tenuis]MBK1679290.1 carbohydrate esterase family protein [Rhodocyclus tenuis]